MQATAECAEDRVTLPRAAEGCREHKAAHAAGPKPFSLGAALRASKSGRLVVVSVVADGPCSRAGVQKGDVVVAVGGERVHTLDQVAASLALAGAQARISVTLRSAAGGGESFDVVLHRCSGGEGKSTTDVAEALRKIAARGPSPTAKIPASESPGRRPGKARSAGKAASRALQDVSNQAGRAQDLDCDGRRSWIVAIAPGCENAPSTRAEGAAAAGGHQQRIGTSVPAKASPPKRHLSAGSPDSALTVASPASPPPAQHGSSGPQHFQMWDTAQMQVREAHATNSPLPVISPSSALLRSLSVSVARSGRGLGEESFSHELQQMHSLLVQSGEAISSLKDELVNAKDSRFMCEELQAAHNVLLEQQGLYKDLLSAAGMQHQRLQAEVDTLQDERNALRISLAHREEALEKLKRQIASETGFLQVAIESNTIS